MKYLRFGLILAVLPARSEAVLPVESVATESEGSTATFEEWTAEEFIADSMGAIALDDAGERSFENHPKKERLVFSWRIVLVGVWIDRVMVMLLRLVLASAGNLSHGKTGDRG